MDAIPGDGAGVVLKPPTRRLWAAELPRAVWTLATVPVHRRRLAQAQRGDGRPVMLIPGLVNSDRSNAVMRRYLTRLGYRVHGWGLGRNLGAKATGADAGRLIAQVRALRDETGEAVTLIGVSLGGIMARWVALTAPELVREVITVSSPFAGDPRGTNVWRVFEWATGEKIDDPAVIARREALAGPLPVPATAIWSASDGIVNGALCHVPGERSIEVRSSHMAVQLHPQALRAIAGVLAGEDHSPAR